MKTINNFITEKLRIGKSIKLMKNKGIFMMSHQFSYQLENIRTYIHNNDLDSDMTNEYDYYKLSSRDTFIQISSVKYDLGEDDMQTSYDLKSLQNLRDILANNTYEVVYILTDILQLCKKPFKKEVEKITNTFSDTKFKLVNVSGELDLRVVRKDFHFNDNVTLHNYLEY